MVIDAVETSRHHRRRLVNVTDASGRAGRWALERLLNRAVDGGLNADETAELGVRLARLVPVLSEEDGAAVRKLAGLSLEQLVAQLLDAAGEEARVTSALLAEMPALRAVLLAIYDGPAATDAGEPTRPSAAAENVRRRLAAFTRHAGPFTAAQLWWIENIAEVTAAEAPFDPKNLDSVPFSGRGGTDGFLGAFGADAAIALLSDLGEALA